MPKEERLQAIKELQEYRGSKVIVYFLGDKLPLQIFGTQIAIDVIQLLNKIFKEEGKTKKITLVIHSMGGNLDTPWPLVNLIREFTDYFEVIIPRKAFSAATMICLGANRIVMNPFSLISPIDPTGQFQNADGKIEQIAIEDIRSYIEFASEKIGLKDRAGKIEILKSLSVVGPKILGSINRTQYLTGKLAKGLLALHLHKVKDKKQIEDIISYLTEKSYSHTHFIGRREARDNGFGKIIEYADAKTQEISDHLFEIISKDMLLDDPFDVQTEIEKNKPKPVMIDSIRAITQSEKCNFEGISNITIYPNGQVVAPFRWDNK
jgi:ATP-dependent protease ClpP protease subunit